MPRGGGVLQEHVKSQEQCRAEEKRRVSKELAKPEGKRYVLARKRGTEESQTDPSPLPRQKQRGLQPLTLVLQPQAQLTDPGRPLAPWPMSVIIACCWPDPQGLRLSWEGGGMEGGRREHAELASQSPPPAPAPPAWGSSSEILGDVWIFKFLGRL